MTNHLSDRDLALQDTDLPQLGPDTVLWRRFGDWRSTFAALYAGLLQITHEDVSTALVQHSNVFDNEVVRLLRSAFPIIRTVYEGEEVGAMIRDYHRDIKGHRNDGSRYHSLDPAVYYWAHATFAAMPYALAGNFMPPMTDEEKERLFQESRAWYRLYGVSEPEGAPRTYAEYEKYFDRVVDEQLDRQETVDRSRIVRALTLDSPLPWLPEWAWRPIAPGMRALLFWVAVGLLPETLRRKLGWSWTRSDAIRFTLFSRAVRGIFTVLPRRVRMVPIAERAFRRHENPR